MATPTSLDEIDLLPLPSKTYFNASREWREEFIYFLLVDRFHDDLPRTPVVQSGRTPGIQTPGTFYGGKIKGITQNLAYIAGLGCTAIWLSPVFENNPGAYHGYSTTNYLDIDPNFGTKQDLIDLVEAAHNFVLDGKPCPIRIILDAVINHSGDTWSYPGGHEYQYANDEKFPFGFWRSPDRPVPVELRNPELYNRRGRMRDFDNYPENQHGDIFGLKDYNNDDDEHGSAAINALIKSYCYWIREADVDGFRVDAIKHMGELACSRFCSNVREYAYSLGKRDFFLFGELAVAKDDDTDNAVDRYIGHNTSRMDGHKTVFFGIDSILDFPLAQGCPLRDVIKGFADPATLFRRLEAQRDRALNRGEIGRFLVTFVDNHDDFWQPGGRISAGAPDAQVIAAIGYLLCALGTPCIYYGTEQGFEGHGSDNKMREAMFDTASPGTNLLNTGCTIYQEISKLARVFRSTPALRFGRMYFRQISGNGIDFGYPFGTTYTLAFSRMVYGSEVLVAYNVSGHARTDSIIIDKDLHHPGEVMSYLYGGTGTVPVRQNPGGPAHVTLTLAPHQFVILG